MGHGAFGLWRSEELATDRQRLDALLEKVVQLQQQGYGEYRQAGREFDLTLSPDGVEVRAARLDEEEEISEGLSHYDQESQASCGLDDFRQLLEAWRVFTTGR